MEDQQVLVQIAWSQSRYIHVACVYSVYQYTPYIHFCLSMSYTSIQSKLTSVFGYVPHLHIVSNTYQINSYSPSMDHSAYTGLMCLTYFYFYKTIPYI